MMNEIVKINASDYGLDSSRAKEIEDMFSPMLEKMVGLETEYNQILNLPIDRETCQKAHDLRIKYVKVRTGTAEIHKKLKEFYLKGGRFVDGWKNAQLFASQHIEETLGRIENHFEILEAERKEKLRAERSALLSPYVQDVHTFMLSDMTQEAFDILLAGAKSQYELKIKAQEQAEADRIAKEKADQAEQQRIRDELAEKSKAFEAERKEKERLASELRAKEEADRLAEKKRKAEEKKQRLAPDKDKLTLFMKSVNELQRPELKSPEANEILTNVNIFLTKVVKYINENLNTI